MEPRSRLIIALDVPDRSAALASVGRLSGHVGYVKIGLEIFVREGPGLVEEILARGEQVFLDLKLHDIPNTVAGAVRSACRLGVQMLTVHIAGGPRMLEAARAAAETASTPPLIVGVTALTSLSPEDARLLGVRTQLDEWVEKLAETALRSRISAVVASPLEVYRLRARFGTDLRYIIPGIRPAGAAAQDQARTATPAEAIRNGADFIVVGRPVLTAADPAAAADEIVAEIAAAI